MSIVMCIYLPRTCSILQKRNNPFPLTRGGKREVRNYRMNLYINEIIDIYRELDLQKTIKS
jgi:hypothetical protein